MNFSMRYRKLCWIIVVIVFLVESGQIRHVYGMPLHLSTGGSESCLDFGTFTGAAKHQRSRIAYEILFRNKNSFIANISYCDLEIWDDAKRIHKHGGNKRSSHKIDSRLRIENPELFKIFVDKEYQGLLHLHSIVQIVCPNRKFTSCIRFVEGKETSPLGRRLLSVDQVYMYRDPNDDGIPLQPVMLLIAGVVILVIAGSLCANCNNNKDDESVSDARPEILAYHERLPSHYESAPQEQNVQEEIVFESKDVVMEKAEKIEGDSVDANNHVAPYEEPMVSVQPGPPQSVQPVPPQSVQHVAPKSVNHVQNNAQHVPPKSVEHVTKGDKKGDKKKRTSKHDHDHEEHKGGKFWKRRHSSKKSESSSEDRKTSDSVSKDDEHKHRNRRSRKESKEQKAKSGKSKDQKGSSESEEKKALDEERSDRPREATPSLDRHSRGLPAPPLPSSSPGHTRLDRPIPQRQCSAPDGTRLVEDDSYETVEVRKTKSVENIDITADDNYDAVRVEVGKPRPPSSAYDSIIVDSPRQSDIYEVVDDTSEPVDDLYDKVEDALKKDKKYDRERCDVEMDKVKNLTENEALENSEFYEEINKREKNTAKSHDYSDAKKVMLDVNNAKLIRNRSQSDTAGLQRSGNEFVKRCHTIDVVREREGEVTRAPLDYVYAEVDLSKKTKRRHSTEGDTGTSQENWSDDNPPPLPPEYVSSKQIQIEMGRTEGR